MAPPPSEAEQFSKLELDTVTEQPIALIAPPNPPLCNSLKRADSTCTIEPAPLQCTAPPFDILAHPVINAPLISSTVPWMFIVDAGVEFAVHTNDKESRLSFEQPAVARQAIAPFPFTFNNPDPYPRRESMQG